MLIYKRYTFVSSNEIHLHAVVSMITISVFAKTFTLLFDNSTNLQFIFLYLMSLGIIIKSPEGIVLAAESRVTLSTPVTNAAGAQHIINNTFDNATKVLKFNDPNNYIGAVTYGQAAIGFRTAQSFIPEFESKLKEKYNNQRLSILTIAQELSSFFLEQWNAAMPANANIPNMIFNVAGFDDNEPYGKVFSFEIPKIPNPTEQNPSVNGQHQFGITWGGQREIVDRMILGYDLRISEILRQAGLEPDKVTEIQQRLTALHLQIPVQFMPLQDCINLAYLFIRTTIDAQELTIGIRGCGGAIDIAKITKNEGFDFVQEKHISVDNKN
jgi:hypothetical protein